MAQPISKQHTFNLAPRTLEEAIKFAELIANSSLCPREMKGKAGDVLIAVQMGAEIGLSPMQAIQNISLINGRPCIWGDALLAIVKTHPHFENINEWIEEDTAYCTVKRKNQEPQTRHFSVEMAKRAGLFGKPGPWQQYPERMLQLRARGFALRDVFPDALKGLITIEEAQDIPTEHVNDPVITATEHASVEVPDDRRMEEVKNLIEQANNMDELRAVAPIARPLSAQAKNTLKNIYREKLKTLKDKK